MVSPRQTTVPSTSVFPVMTSGVISPIAVASQAASRPSQRTHGGGLSGRTTVPVAKVTHNTSLERTVRPRGRAALAKDCVLAGAELAERPAVQFKR
jgi:hypothetical protein